MTRSGFPLLAFGLLEWTFVVILVVLVVVTGLFAGFLLTQLFRDHGRRR